jgi:hypothetical protein
MDGQPTLPVADVLGAGRPELSWDSAPGAGCLCPAESDRSRGFGDLGMAGLHIGAPACLSRVRRAAQPGGASTPLVRDPGELLSRTYSGSSARVDYRQRLELNTQDSNEDVLFWQKMRYPEREAEGFSNLRRARRGVDHGGSEPASHEREEHGPPAGASHHFGSSRPWASVAAANRPPMPPRHSASAPLPPRGPQDMPSPRHDKSLQQPRRDRYNLLPRGYSRAVRGIHSLRRAAGQDSLPHRSWDLAWRPCKA